MNDVPTDLLDRVAATSLLDPAVQNDPFPFYELLHQACPVYRMPETGFYVVTTYDDVRAVLRNPQTFSSDTRAIAALQGKSGALYQDLLEEGGGWRHVQTLQRTDPPEHTRSRSIVEKAFITRRVRELASYVDALAHELIDRWIDKGECEFVRDFSIPFPGSIVADLVGLDRADVPRFTEWADCLLRPQVQVLDEAGIRATAATEIEMQKYMQSVFDARRAEPRDDLISALVHTQPEVGAPLSGPELQNVVRQLITGGYETTASSIAHGMWALLRFPEQQAKLREDRSLMKNFLEELVRYEAPLQGHLRTTTQETVLNGVTIPAGAVIIVRWGAANRDASRFACPHAFDVERDNAGAHLGYGSGVHFCPGAMLARQMMGSAFNALLDRLASFELARPLPQPEHRPNLLLIPLKELPIKFTKA